ncbi:MAG: hypothetical protein AAFV93_06045 [Chloroflexota bacterium]
MQTNHIEHSGNTISGVVTASKYFDFTQSLAFLDNSGASDRLDVLNADDGLLQRTMLLDDHPYLVTLQSQEDTDLEVIVQSPDGEDAPTEAILTEAVAWANRRFWLDVDMDTVKDAITGDEYGDMLADTFSPSRPANYPSAWEALLISVTHAQIYPGLAIQLDDTLAVVFRPKATFDEQTYYLTPRPFDLLRANEEELKGMRFSRQKADYLTTIPQTIMNDLVTYDFDDMRQRDGEEIVKTLKDLRGVGAWTSQNVAMRGLPHTDVFIDEKSTRKAIAPFYYRNGDAITKKNFQKTVARFAPYRSFACYYTYMHHFGMEDDDANAKSD